MRLVPPRLQMEYNLLAPYTSSSVRTVRLLRRAETPVTGSAVFGFSIRGGREHGTGFFVSEVGAEAREAGLRVGDQIVRINGYPVEHAIHQEVLKLIQDSKHLNLKVRCVGMIPVKDRRCDPLTWKMVATEETPPSPSTTPTLDSLEQPELRNMTSEGVIDGNRDLIQYLNIVGRSKLDCCICKGPEWRPGIFIQSTKEGGFAREAGLRPGDQIVECNGVNFEDISFSDAVSALKKDKNLNLVIRKGSGTDLFPGESSGYNSSASSINGDGSNSGHSPNGACQGWNDDGTKRLSIVREEVSDINASMLGNGVSQSSDGRVAIDKNKDWDEIEYEWEVADKQHSSAKNDVGEHKVPLSIHIDARDRGVSEEDSINEVSVEVQTQEVVAMVHRTEEDETDNGEWNDRGESPESHNQIQQAASTVSHSMLAKTNSSSSSGSILTAISLSSALSEEIQRRAKRLGSADIGCSDGTIKRKTQSKEEGVVKKDLLKEIACEKRMQHSKLMEEFKKAHSKMFANSQALANDTDKHSQQNDNVEERSPTNGNQEEKPVKSDSNSQKELSPRNDEINGQVDANVSEETEAKRGAASLWSIPPPPPPMPLPEFNVENGSNQEEKLTITPSIPSSSQKQMSNVRAHSSECSSPRSPKSALFTAENNIQIIQSGKPDQANQKPDQVNLKPAQIPQTKGAVSVTISEYPSANIRRAQPTRFDFLPATKPMGKRTGDSNAEVKQSKDWNNVNSQLQSELLQTLSRSRLKAQTEGSLEERKQSSKVFLAGNDCHNAKENGTVEVESMASKQNSVVSRYLSHVYGPETPVEVAQSPRSPSSTAFQNTEKILNALANKVTIRIPNNNPNAVNKVRSLESNTFHFP